MPPTDIPGRSLTNFPSDGDSEADNISWSADEPIGFGTYVVGWADGAQYNNPPAMRNIHELQRELGDKVLEDVGQILPLIDQEGSAFFFQTDRKSLVKLMASFVDEKYFSKNNKLDILARIKSTAVVGCPPELMGLGPINASKKALDNGTIVSICSIRPLIFMPISAHSSSYNSRPPPYRNQDTQEILSKPKPPPAVGDPKSIVAGW